MGQVTVCAKALIQKWMWCCFRREGEGGEVGKDLQVVEGVLSYGETWFSLHFKIPLVVLKRMDAVRWDKKQEHCLEGYCSDRQEMRRTWALEVERVGYRQDELGGTASYMKTLWKHEICEGRLVFLESLYHKFQKGKCHVYCRHHCAHYRS